MNTKEIEPSESNLNNISEMEKSNSEIQEKEIGDEREQGSDNNENAQENIKKVNPDKDDESYLNAIFKDISNSKDNKNIFIQYRIENNHGIITGDGSQFEDVFINGRPKKEQSGKAVNTIVDNEEELYHWITDNYESFNVAFLIACAVFDGYPSQWISEAASKLCTLFPNKSSTGEKETARENIIKTIGAEIYQDQINTYTGKVMVDFVRFKKYSDQDTVIKCIWREFPQVRGSIITWLKNYILKERPSLSKRAVDTLGYLCYLDYYYFLNHIIPFIIREKSISNDMILAQVILSLKERDEYKGNIKKMMSEWSGMKLNNIHYLLVALLVCTEQPEYKKELQNAIQVYVKAVSECIWNKKKDEYMDQLFCFFASGIRCFTFYRILIESMYDMLQADLTVKNKRMVCTLFLMLFSIDVSLSSKEEEALFIKICFAKHEVRTKLCSLWQAVWQSNSHRKDFYFLLGEYASLLEEEKNIKIKNFINAAFEDTCTAGIKNDITAKICAKVRRD